MLPMLKTIRLCFDKCQLENTTIQLPHLIMIWPTLLLLQLCIAHQIHQQECPPPRIRQLCEFPNVTWIENIAVRSNGQLLVKPFTSPELYQIDPFQQSPTPKIVAHFS